MKVDTTKRLTAFSAYLLPIISWLYILKFQRKNDFAVFHLRQAIGLVVYLIGIFVCWAVLTWVLSWIPYGFLLGVAMFAIVLTALIIGLLAWLIGLVNALYGRAANLPLFGQLASRLPF
jgi:uncharacterized membrane protein